jgi:copper chaperone CopZ
VIQISGASWIKIRAVGMQCECCWEQTPVALRGVEGVELVRVDAGEEIVSVKLIQEVTDVEQLVERVLAILEQRFGFLCSVLSS